MPGGSARVPSVLFSDHLSSTSKVAKSSGGLHSQQLYKAWGQTRYTSGTLPTRYTYTGQYTYATGSANDFGLIYYGARFYDNALGRWAQPDSIIPASQGVQGWDRYAFVNNNPVLYTDPSGHFTVLIGAAIGAIAGVAIVAATHPNLQTRDYIQAAMVGATAGALIGTGVGIGAGTAIGATLLGAGVGAATSAAGYAITAGDSYNSNEMGANALIGTATGAASALTGPAIFSANGANSGAAILARAGINALGTQASQIVQNEYFDEGTYPTGGESAAAAGLGGSVSIGGEVADRSVNLAVTAISGNQAAGQVAGSITYNLVKNFGSSYYVNKGLNFIDWAAEEGSTAK